MTTIEVTQSPDMRRQPSEHTAWHRTRISRGIRGEIPLLVVGKGQCSTNIRDINITHSEARDHRAFMDTTPDVLVTQRQNHWKPRSPREDGSTPWEGMETTHLNEALKLHLDSLGAGVPICMEVALPRHLERYAAGLTLAWIGARNRDKNFIVEATILEKHLPLGIKNDLAGNVDWALTMADAMNHIRTNVAGSAPVFLVDRGGTELNTPRRWEDHTKRTLERTRGQHVICLGHGTEQAHDPDGNFGKSVEGQISAMEHYIKIGEQTGMWANGLLLEASDAPSDTDPNMPHQIALDGIAHIASLMHTQAPQVPPRHFDQEFPDQSYYY